MHCANINLPDHWILSFLYLSPARAFLSISTKMDDPFRPTPPPCHIPTPCLSPFLPFPFFHSPISPSLTPAVCSAVKGKFGVEWWEMKVIDIDKMIWILANNGLCCVCLCPEGVYAVLCPFLAWEQHNIYFRNLLIRNKLNKLSYWLNWPITFEHTM